jgi:hypothetical protein
MTHGRAAWLAARPVRDPQVVPVGIEEPEVGKPPRAKLEVLVWNHNLLDAPLPPVPMGRPSAC